MLGTGSRQAALCCASYLSCNEALYFRTELSSYVHAYHWLTPAVPLPHPWEISLQESRALGSSLHLLTVHLPCWWVPNSYLPCCFLFTSHTAFFFFSSGKTSPWLCVHKSWGQRGLSFIEARGLCWIMSCLNSNVCFSKPSKLLDLTCTTAKRGQKTPYFAWKVKYSSFVMALLREWKMWGEVLIPDILLGPRLIHVRALYTLLAAWRWQHEETLCCHHYLIAVGDVVLGSYLALASSFSPPQSLASGVEIHAIYLRCPANLNWHSSKGNEAPPSFEWSWLLNHQAWQYLNFQTP